MFPEVKQSPAKAVVATPIIKLRTSVPSDDASFPAGSFTNSLKNVPGSPNTTMSICDNSFLVDKRIEKGQIFHTQIHKYKFIHKHKFFIPHRLSKH